MSHRGVRRKVDAITKAALHGLIHGFSVVGEFCGVCKKVKVSRRRWKAVPAECKEVANAKA